jgi:NAD(P)-dependent dehydrogenase (short-subunit alcohol dehydrogenase family)
MSFAGKNILVIGGSSGIGLALVKQLHSAGAKVFNASRHASTDWPTGVTHIELDVLGDVGVLGAQLPEQLNGLVYCVGSINLKPFHRLTKNDFLNDYMLNVVGAAEVVQQALKSLKSAPEAGVVLFSTVAAKTGLGFHASIAAAKSGVEGLALSLAAELAPSHIRVNVIAPSLTDTPLATALLNTPEKRDASAKRHPLGKFGTADDIASAAKFLLSDESNWMTGQVIGIDGGLGKLRGI